MEYTSVRVESSLIGPLSLYRDRLKAQVGSEPDRYPEWLRDGPLSLSNAIRYLLKQQEGHSGRARKSARKTTVTIDQNKPPQGAA